MPMRAGAVLVAVALLSAPAWALPGPRTTGTDPLVGVVDALQAADPSHPAAAVAATLRAIAQGEGRDVPALGACMSLPEALALQAARVGLAAPPLPAMPQAEADALGCLLGALHKANLAHDATFAGLRTSDLLAFADRTESTPALDAMLAGRDHGLILEAAIGVAEAVDRAMPALQALRAQGSLEPIDQPPLLNFEPDGVDSRYGMVYALQVDFGGDDVYDNTAGGIIAVVGSGIYEAQNEQVKLGPIAGWNVGVGGQIQDGDAVLSASLVLDFDGDDIYGVKYPPFFHTDQECTTEPIINTPGTIGGGVMGVGMLFDMGSGTNHYYGRTQTSGAGHVLGVGVLSTSEGVDIYEAQRAAQGSGLLGGIGLLLDAGGDDVYRVAAPPGGIHNGDMLICDDDPRYAFGSAFDRRNGAAPALIGILADYGGNDQYVGGRLVEGFGMGPGFGLLYEPHGNDRYSAVEKSQGAAQGREVDQFPQSGWRGGAGILLDTEGDDAYAITGTSGLGQAWTHGASLDPLPAPSQPGVMAWLAQRANNEAFAALFDTAGADSYSGVAGRGNGVDVVQDTLAIFHDSG
jgi:hypothetical protein